MQANIQPIGFQQLFGTRPDAAAQAGSARSTVSVYDRPTVIRIGNQISTLLTDNAIPHDALTVQSYIWRCMALGVSTPRGVQCVVIAYCGECRTDIDRVSLLVEAVLWERAWVGNYPCNKSDIESSSTHIAALLGSRPIDHINLDDVQGTIQKYLRDLIEGDALTQPTRKLKLEAINLLELEENHYRSVRNDDEFVISREFGIHPTSGEPMYGQWVLRNYRTGEFIDSDHYIADITERNNFKIIR